MNSPLPNGIKAVTFDVGGTLIRPWPSVGHVYAEIASRGGFRTITPEVLNHRFTTAWRGLRNFNHGREEWASLVDRTFDGLVDRPPSKTFFPELYERFSEPAVWQVFDDVLPTLDALAANGALLGIISNWDERLRPLLEKLGLSKYFEFIIISCEVGFAKPSPVIFEHATKKLGTAPEFILHVGDSVEHDFDGATGAGFRALRLERGRQEADAGVIGSLRRLEEIGIADP